MRCAIRSAAAPEAPIGLSIRDAALDIVILIVVVICINITWQYFRVDTDGLTPDDRQRLIDVLESFGCRYQESHGGP